MYVIYKIRKSVSKNSENLNFILSTVQICTVFYLCKHVVMLYEQVGNSIKSDHYILYIDTLISLKFFFLNARYLHIYMETSMFQIKRATSFRVVPLCTNFHTHTFSKCPTVECLSPSETTNKSGYLFYLLAKPNIKILVNLTGILHSHFCEQILTWFG